HKLSVRPEGALVDKQPAVAFMDETCGPWLRSPSCVEVFLQEQRELIWVRHGNDLDVAALVVSFHAVTLQPVAQGDVLSVAELRGSYTLAVEVFRFLNSAVVAHDER